MGLGCAVVALDLNNKLGYNATTVAKFPHTAILALIFQVMYFV